MSQITILVQIALREEYEVFCRLFPAIEDASTQTQLRCIHRSTNEQIKIVSALATKPGSQSAASSAEDAIRDFKPNLIVVLGIAGNLSNDIQLCDVVVADWIADVLHNSKYTENNGKQSTEFSPDFYQVHPSYTAQFVFLTTNPFRKEAYEHWQTAAGSEAASNGIKLSEKPSLHIGMIVCGPVTASVSLKRQFSAIHRKVQAIETESGGVFHVAGNRQIHAIAIRGICDNADSKKNTLEMQSKGLIRRIAMENAVHVFSIFLNSQQAVSAIFSHQTNGSAQQSLEFALPHTFDPMSEIFTDVRSNLEEHCPEYKNQKDGAYLPIPRARKIIASDDFNAPEFHRPEEILKRLREDRKIIVHLDRSFPSASFSWGVANSLLGQQINGKPIVPIVLEGREIKPPKNGLGWHLSNRLTDHLDPELYQTVFIIEEPPFMSRSKLRFLIKETNSEAGAMFLFHTKASEHAPAISEFARETNSVEHKIAPVSFSELSLFIQKTFMMKQPEADTVATKLVDTFRRFRLETHPSYFAGIQEETLAALINANRRSELVDGLLSLIVATDTSVYALRRTTRERFLQKVAVELYVGQKPISHSRLVEIAETFIVENAFPGTTAQIIDPFFSAGLLFLDGSRVTFSHYYVECYLVANYMSSHEEDAKAFFDPSRDDMNVYVFDLYCEIGPHASVLQSVFDFAVASIEMTKQHYPGKHVYLAPPTDLARLTNRGQIERMTRGLMDKGKHLEAEDNTEEVRATKQRLLDTDRHVRTEVTDKKPSRKNPSSAELATEFKCLDDLSKSLNLIGVAIGAGSEQISGETKKSFAAVLVRVADVFSDVWTRNRLRTDFASARKELMSDTQIWEFMREHELPDELFTEIKNTIDVMLTSHEINFISEPMTRVLWDLTNLAGFRVLEPVVADLKTQSEMELFFRYAWLLEVNGKVTKDSIKEYFKRYRGTEIIRVAFGAHLLLRIFWQHYRTAAARDFFVVANRILRPLGLQPNQERITVAQNQAE